MAKRRATKSTKSTKSRKSKSLQPAHRFMYFNLQATGASEDFHYIDISQCLSMLNRRLYRQGMTYHVANATIHDSNGDASVKLATLPQNWSTQKAWNVMYDAWRTQRARALSGTAAGAKKTGKWSDFKVWLSQDHVTDTDILLPIDIEDTVVAQGEWNYADIAFVSNLLDYDRQNVWMLGDNDFNATPPLASGVGVIQCYQEILAIPQGNPDLPADFDESVIFGMNPAASQVVQQKTLDDIVEENDEPPYSAPYLVGSLQNAKNALAVREMGILSDSQATATVGGFPVPLGLLCVETYVKGGTENTIGLILEIVPGTYKGVMAESYA